MDDCLTRAIGVAAIFKAPALPFAIVFQSGIVVTFVEVFKYRGEYLRVFIRKIDPLVGGGKELITTGGLEVRRVTENVFM